MTAETNNRLQQIRENLGFTRAELSEKSGIKMSMIQKYELGYKDLRKASYDTVKAYADALGVNADVLVNENFMIFGKNGLKKGSLIECQLRGSARMIADILREYPSMDKDGVFNLVRKFVEQNLKKGENS